MRVFGSGLILTAIGIGAAVNLSLAQLPATDLYFTEALGAIDAVHGTDYARSIPRDRRFRELGPRHA